MDKPIAVDLEQLAMALQDQSSGIEWLLNTDTGELRVGGDGEWLEDALDDDVEDSHLVPVEPIPPNVWYRHMEDFAAKCDDLGARESLHRALEGKGAFRRFKDTLHQRYPDLVPEWRTYQDQRAAQVARDWLTDRGLAAK